MRVQVCLIVILAALASARVPMKPGVKVPALDKHVVEAFFTKSLERFRHVVNSGHSQLSIPAYDPYHATDAKIRIDDQQSRLLLTAEDVFVESLSRYEVSNVTFTSSDHSIYFSLTLPKLKFQGTYAVDGSLQQQEPLYGQGPYGVTLHAAEITGHATLVEARLPQVKNIVMDLKYKAIATAFSNLPASSTAGLTNKDLSMKLGRSLSSQIANDIVHQVAGSLEAFLNYEIFATSPVPMVGETGNANDYMDQVLALVRQQIIEQGLNRIKLPDGDISFSVPVWPIGDVYGGVYLHDGFMGGLETIHRIGNATLSFTDTDIFFESDLAINNGILGYSLTISFMDIGPTASMTGTLSYANFYFKARLSLSTGEIVIEEYNIKEIGHIDTEITGLGIFNWLAEIIANFAINLIKGFVKEILEGPIRNLIQFALDQILASLAGTTTVASYYIA